MENTKKYKFVGDSSGWGWVVNPIKGVIYDEDTLEKMYGKKWKSVGGIKLIENWDLDCYDDIGIWEEITDQLSIVEKLIKLNEIFDVLLSCTSEIWEEIKEGDPNISVEDQGEVLRLISSITFKYDQLNKEFNS